MHRCDLRDARRLAGDIPRASTLASRSVNQSYQRLQGAPLIAFALLPTQKNMCMTLLPRPLNNLYTYRYTNY